MELLTRTRTKKNECMYLHVTLASNDEQIKALNQDFTKQFEKLGNCLKQMQTDLEKRDSEIKHLNEKLNNLEKICCENPESNLKKDLEVKDTQINGLELRLHELEKEIKTYKKQQEKKIKELENTCKQKARKEKDSVTKVTKENLIKCQQCDFTSTSRQGLKIHNSRKHSKIKFEEFPAACDICEKVLESETNLKKHKKSEHSYHTVKYQCNECGFMANEVQTLHVHFGVEHSIKKLCGLCDKEFSNSQLLDDHLSECQIFVCSNSGCSKLFETLTPLKEHIKEEHKKGSPAHYQFSYWKYSAQDKSEKEINKKYHTIYPKDW